MNSMQGHDTYYIIQLQGQLFERISSAHEVQFVYALKVCGVSVVIAYIGRLGLMMN